MEKGRKKIIRRKIIVLTPTKSGKTRDKKVLDKSGIESKIPANIAKWFDTGFIGANSDTVMMPKKKPKGKALSQEEKQENKTISVFRIFWRVYGI